MTLEERLRRSWSELNPSDPWLGAAAGLEAIVEDIKALRLLNGLLIEQIAEAAPEENEARPADEIQRAHDILAQLALDSVMFNMFFAEAQHTLIYGAVDVLCWVLRHEHNKHFGDNLAKIEARLAEMGIEITRSAQKFHLKDTVGFGFQKEE
jgi:hypothetical protein